MAKSPGPWTDFMSNAFAPQPYDEFEDEFDLEAGYSPTEPAAATPDPAPAAFAGPAGSEARPTLQFTAPAHPAGPVEPSAPVLHPSATAPQVPAVSDFNPVGDLVAGAASAF